MNFRESVKSINKSLDDGSPLDREDVQILSLALSKAKKQAATFLGYWMREKTGNPMMDSFESRLREIDDYIQQSLDEDELEKDKFS
jgi:hypothetical protein